MDEFSPCEHWYGRDEPPCVHRPVPGAVFSLSHVLPDLRELAGEQLAARSNALLLLEALAARVGGLLAVLVANLTPARQRCRIAALPARSVAVRRLDEERLVHECNEPASFRVGLALELAPFEDTRGGISL